MPSDPWSYNEISIDFVADKNVTIAVVALNEGYQSVKFTGSAKRVPGDPYNQTIGQQLALSRALAKASRALEKAALR